jgi:ketosteroid isomerase-like protein
VTDAKVEIVKKYFDAWNSASFEPEVEDIDAAVAIDWSESNAPYAGTYSGHDGWRELFGEIVASFQGAWAEAHEYVVAGPYVAVHNTAHLRGREGIEVAARSTIVFTFREDKIVAARLYQNHADALAAIGAGNA